MELEVIIGAVTLIVTWVLGELSKKYGWIEKKVIPLQNLLVGVIAGLIYSIITKDVNLVISSLGLFAGGTYDVFHNLRKIINEEVEEIE